MKVRKKFLIYIMTGMLGIGLFGNINTEAKKVKSPVMNVYAYCVMDANSGKVIFSQNVDKKIYPASTAKLMTAIVAVEQGDLDSKIKTKSSVVHNTTYGTYNLGLPAGKKFSFSAMLNMSLISSAADATDSIAVEVAGSKKKFAKLMNEKVEELGLTHTSFDNPVGSDIGGGFYETYSTAREMSKIARYAMANKTIRKIVAKKSYNIPGFRSITNTNWFYTQVSYDKSLYKIIGSKTGTTTAAGHVFIATAVDQKGHEVICAYFGKASKESTFYSIRALLNKTFKGYKSGKIELQAGAYNVRYDKGNKVYGALIDCKSMKQKDDGTVDKKQKVTKKDIPYVVEYISNKETTKTKEKENAVTKDLSQSMEEAYPGITKIPGYKLTTKKMEDSITAKELADFFGNSVNLMQEYAMSKPICNIHDEEDIKENPVAFMDVMELSDKFIEEHTK